MSSFFRSSLAVLALILPAFTITPLAIADTYKVSVVDVTQNSNFLGIDDSGNFVVNEASNSFKCGKQSGPCFEVFYLDQSPFFSTTAPAFDGPDPSDILLVSGSFDGGFINSHGDAVFINGLHDELIFAQNLTTAATPEPSSLFLIGTGCLTMVGTLRRTQIGKLVLGN